MKAMETLQDLIEEAKVRTVWWALCIFATAYFLTHTSKSMWMNLPISILFVSGLRILFSEVEFHWKERNVRPLTYLSHLEKRQLSVNDSRLFTLPSPPRWKRKIYSPLVEAAMEDFINKLLQDFVVDLWSEITPDKEAPDLIHAIIMDVLGEISGRVREINLVELLTRDIVNLIGDHLDLFRRNQAAIGVDVMKTLSSEERDERLKYYLISSKELHPALISPECEYKVLQHLMGGVLARVLRPRESQCPLVRCIARELLTALVMQPLMNMASPGNINELIEYIFLAKKDEGVEEGYSNQSPNFGLQSLDHTVATDYALHGESTLNKNASLPNQGSDMTLSRNANQGEPLFYAHGCSVTNEIPDEPINLQPADWAQVLNVATSRRTEVLMPENLENMWTKGRHYKKKTQKTSRAAILAPVAKDSGTCAMPKMDLEKEMSIFRPDFSSRIEDKSPIHLPPRSYPDAQVRDRSKSGTHLSHEAIIETSPVEGHLIDKLEDSASLIVRENRARLKRSNSASDLIFHPKVEGSATSKSDAPIISEFYSANFSRHKEVHNVMSASDMVVHSDRLHNPKIKCRVLGAYFEKHGSKSFAVYSISVTDANKTTWFVKRRYSNFERLHRRLKEIPNYTLHLPPKRIFSSSTEDAFVHQRCIQLDKYLQDLLSIANVAEQHEVWDFLSSSSKNYFCGKSSSVMRTLAVNVDDAVDDIIQQFKGTSHGLVKKDGSPSLSHESVSSVSGRNLSWSVDDINKQVFQKNTAESTNSFSDNEEGDKDGNQGHGETNSSTKATGWHSDNELNFNRFPPRVVKCIEEVKNSHSEEKHISGLQPESLSLIGYPVAALPVTSGHIIDTTGVPLKWDPPKLSVPVLNLVDNIFQLKQRGWLRRQVLWISKQILQLMMEDAIDDWLLRQIQLLRKDDTIAQGIHWVQDALWPNGTFFLKLNNQSEVDDSSDHKSSQPSSHLEGSKFAKPGCFEQQLEAARRASDVKKMIFDGPPTTLVGLIGHKQYRRCARDIYFFLQSTTCLKQLAYGILELLLVSIFPELRDLVLDVHDKMRV